MPGPNVRKLDTVTSGVWTLDFGRGASLGLERFSKLFRRVGHGCTLPTQSLESGGAHWLVTYRIGLQCSLAIFFSLGSPTPLQGSYKHSARTLWRPLTWRTAQGCVPSTCRSPTRPFSALLGSLNRRGATYSIVDRWGQAPPPHEHSVPAFWGTTLLAVLAVSQPHSTQWTTDRPRRGARIPRTTGSDSFAARCLPFPRLSARNAPLHGPPADAEVQRSGDAARVVSLVNCLFLFP